ncbi:uncharacterized protein LOC133831553 [Humulus lupulus]|uniref:uncharacterized protein LOC133831553 n=1 Tax=Humulus lupulus TaxID=3486 RepID=UPI002B409434|nr:uncharacterized protein LOC133831553 [Humulus lupulus]
MGFGKKREKGVHKQEGYHRMRSEPKTQPHEIWQSTVPKWEKDFCATVGSVPWGKLLDTKKYIHLYENVIDWNDSASEEAFIQAKNRFWAYINGFTSEIALPDPDIYIDEVDWNSEIDPELFLDLERQPEQTDHNSDDEKVLILSNAQNLNNIELGIDDICPTGWGDDEEEVKVDTSIPSLNPGDDGKHAWEHNYDYNGWNNNFAQNDVDRERYPTWGMNSSKKDGSGWHNSGYQRSRFSGNDYHQQRNNGHRGRRRQWKCAPVNNHSGSGRGENHAWGWEKQVW